jgi:hypothetical protein
MAAIREWFLGFLVLILCVFVIVNGFYLVQSTKDLLKLDISDDQKTKYEKLQTYGKASMIIGGIGFIMGVSLLGYMGSYD